MIQPGRRRHMIGTRPNFMKVAPLLLALDAAGFENVLVQSGQHYDAEMSETFFAQLGLPEPDHFLGIASGPNSKQTAAVMTALEAVLEDVEPNHVLAVGT